MTTRQYQRWRELDNKRRRGGLNASQEQELANLKAKAERMAQLSEWTGHRSQSRLLGGRWRQWTTEGDE